MVIMVAVLCRCAVLTDGFAGTLLHRVGLNHALQVHPVGL